MSIITTHNHLIETPDGYMHLFQRRCHRNYKCVSADYTYVISRYFKQIEEMQEHMQHHSYNEIEREIQEDYQEVRFLEVPNPEDSDYEEVAQVHKLQRSPRLEDIHDYVEEK